MDRSEKNIVYTDFVKNKKLDSNGGLKKLNNNDALEQSIKIWIASQRGEKIRSLSGGILVPFIGKGLTDANAERIRQVLWQGLEEYFVPNITVVKLDVVPDRDRHRWEIYIVGYNVELSVGVNTKVLIADN